MPKRKYTRQEKILRKQYSKQRKRLQDAIRKIEKEGYYVPVGFKYDKLNDLDISEITPELIAEMKSIKPKIIRESSRKAEVVQIDYDELYDGDYDELYDGDYDIEATREQEYMSINIDNVFRMREDLEKFPNGKGAKWLLNWLDDAVNMFDSLEVGYEIVGQAAKELYYGEFMINIKKIAYNEEEAGIFANDMFKLMRVFIEENTQFVEHISTEKYQKFNYFYTEEAKQKFDEFLTEQEGI